MYVLTIQKRKTLQMKVAIVFDFDLTLSAKHAFNTLYLTGHRKGLPEKLKNLTAPDLLNSEEFVVDYLFGGEERLARLDSFLTELTRSDFTLAIASNGYAIDIAKILTKLSIRFDTPSKLVRSDGSSVFSYIYAIDNTDPKTKELWRNDGVQKRGDTRWTEDAELQKLSPTKVTFIKELKKRYSECVVFVDDDAETTGEYKKVREFGVKTIPMPAEGGIDTPQFEAIMEAVGRCMRCGDKTELSCKGCGLAYYCDSQCQREDWEGHHTYCRQKQNV